MNVLTLAIGLLALSVAIDTTLSAVIRLGHLGRFKILRDDDTAFSFVSSTGAFSVNHQTHVLTFQLRRSRRRGTLPLQQIATLRYSASDDHALAQELVLGFDLADLFPDYRDSVEIHSIHVVTTGDEVIPLYVRGTSHRRELFMGWYIGLQDRLLGSVGLGSDMRERSNTVHALIKDRLRM